MSEKTYKEFSWEEVKKHNKVDDIWLVIEDSIYDVSKWAKWHPGGEIIYKFAAKDCTEVFLVNHNLDNKMKAKLRAFKIGKIAESEKNYSSEIKEFRELIKELKEEGFYETSYFYYFIKVSVVILSFLLSVWATLVAKDPWIAGISLALAWHQSAFLAHDTLHNGVTHNVKLDSFLGYVCGTLFLGIPSQWWKDNHHSHHVVTNLVETKENNQKGEKPPHINGPDTWFGDPQMIYTPIWYTDSKMLSVYCPPKYFGISWGKLLVKFQHITFLPLHLIVGRWNIYVLGIYNCFLMKLWKEALGYTFFFSWLILLSLSWETISSLLIFLFVSHTIVGTMHLQLNLTHFGQPMLFRSEMEELGYLRSQLMTTRNLDASWMTHWFHGGLEFQNEHHLFPMIPRHNLSKISPKIQKICKKYGIIYQSCSFWDALDYILDDLKKIACHPMGDEA